MLKLLLGVFTALILVRFTLVIRSVRENPHTRTGDTPIGEGQQSSNRPGGIQFVNRLPAGDACAKINIALNKLPPGKGIVDARDLAGTVQSCASNMFAGYTGPGGILLLPPMILQITGQQVQPTQFIVEGSGSSLDGTVIRAVNGFSTRGEALWVMSNGGRFNHESQLRDATIDCNGVRGTTGFFSTDINEQSGLSDVSIVNCPSFGIDIDAHDNSVGPAQTYFLRDIEIYSNQFGNGSSIGVRLIGNGGGGPSEIANVTASGSNDHPIRAGFLFANMQGAFAHGLHAEYAKDVVDLGDSTWGGVVNTTLINVSGGNGNTGSVIEISNGETNSVCLIGITRNRASFVLSDDVRLKYLTDRYLTQYCLGNGSVQPYLSSSSNLPSRPPQVPFKGLPDSADNGAIVYCSDCATPREGGPCLGGGSGREAIRVAGAWKCF